MSGPSKFIAALVAGWVVVMAPAPAVAQLIQLDPAPGAGSAAPLDDAEAASARPAVDAEERGRRVAATGNPAEADPSMRRVPFRVETVRIDDQQFPRLSGESAIGRFVMFLPAAPGATELSLSHRSSIDVLPEESTLTVVVNGVDLGEIAPDNFSGFADDELPVPAGVLQQGRNIVEIVARHSHRVACGPDASFAVWTELRAAESGVSVPADLFRPDAQGFIAALAAQVAQGEPVQIRRADPRAALTEAAPFVAELSEILGGAPPEFESMPFWALDTGATPFARITAFPEGQGPPQPRFARGGDGAIVLLVEQNGDWSGIRRLLQAVADTPGQDGLRVLRPGVDTPLAALRDGRLLAEGRYAVVPVGFELPRDWLALTSAKARLDMDYRFSPGLPDGSLMLVKMNGTTIQMLPLEEGDGLPLPTLTITFPARLLRPGANRLDFEVLVPGDPVDRACPRLADAVVEVSPESRLFVPETPRMSLPSIDASLAGISSHQVVPTVRASGLYSPGLVPQIAAALAGEDENAPDLSGERRLTVAALADVESIDPTHFGGDLAPLMEALSRERFLGAGALASGSATAWDVVDGDAETAPERAGGVTGLAQRVLGELRQLAFGASEPLQIWLSERTAQAAILQPDPDRPGEVWLVLGPQADPRDIARILAASLELFDGPTGQLAIWSDEHGWESWTSPERHLSLHEPINARNLREIMGTYATLEPLYFLGVTLALTVLSVAVALSFLLVTRGRG